MSIENTKFYGFTIISKRYDEERNLISTRNFEKERGFSFSIEMLIKKFKKEYNIDLEFPINDGMTVLRGSGIYTVRIPLTDSFYSNR